MHRLTGIFAGATIDGLTKRIFRSHDHHPIPDVVTGLGAPWWGTLAMIAAVLSSRGKAIMAIAGALQIVSGLTRQTKNQRSISVELAEITV